jgi:hypothetical protein
METLDIPLWVKLLGVFIAVAGVFLLAAWDIIVDWISDTAKGFLRNDKR